MSNPDGIQQGDRRVLAAAPLHFERFAGCGHGIVPDDTERAFTVLGEFIADSPPSR